MQGESGREMGVTQRGTGCPVVTDLGIISEGWMPGLSHGYIVQH